MTSRWIVLPQILANRATLGNEHKHPVSDRVTMCKQEATDPFALVGINAINVKTEAGLVIAAGQRAVTCRSGDSVGVETDLARWNRYIAGR